MKTTRKRPMPPLFVPAAALILGILAARYYEFFPYTVAVACLTATAAVFFTRRLPLFMSMVVAVFFAAGFGAFCLYGPGAPSYAGTLADSGGTLVEGVVVKPPQERDGYTVVMLKPYGAHNGVRRAGLVRLTVSGRGLGIRYGDVLRGELRLKRPVGLRNPGVFDWGEYARLNGIDAVASAGAGALYRTGNTAGPVLGSVYSLRRELMAKAGRSLEGPEGAIFRAIILGDQGGVDEEMRDAFSASGTTHILSVSGSHIALLAGFVFFLAGALFRLLPPGVALRLSMRVDTKKLAAAIAIPATIGYCLIAGSEVATVRSTIMVCIFLVSILIDRQNQVLNTLSAAAMVLLLADPSALFDISFRLSFLAVMFIALSISWLGGWRPGLSRLPAWAHGPARKSVSAFVMSVAAVAGTAPLVAGQFNSFSYVSIPANLALMPLTGILAVPAGLISCLADALRPGPGLPLSGVVSFSMDAFYGLVRFFASAPSANLHPPSFGPVATTAYFAMLITGFTWRTKAIKKAAVLALIAAVLVIALVQPGDGGRLKVSFLDVGQGDCAVVQMPDGTTMLVDCGGQPYGYGPGKAAAGPYLWNRGIRSIDYVVISHPQPDHFSGLAYLMGPFDVGQVWEGGLVSDGTSYASLREKIKENGIPRFVAPAGMETVIGGVRVQTLHNAASVTPDGFSGIGAMTNNRCLVIRLKYKDVSFLFTGDAEKEAQYSMLEDTGSITLRSDVLKVPHHGSIDACLPAFIDAVSPKVAVISAGRANRFGHPSPGTVEALEAAGSGVYCTAWDGAVTVTTDGHDIEVETCASRALEPAHGWKQELKNLARLMAIQKTTGPQ